MYSASVSNGFLASANHCPGPVLIRTDSEGLTEHDLVHFLFPGSCRVFNAH